MSGIHKIELGKELHVADWTLDGLVDIVQTQGLELDQLFKKPYSFDYKMAGRIVSIRSQAALKAAHVRNNRCNHCAEESYAYPEWDALFLYHARALAHKEFYEETTSRYRNDVALRAKTCEEVRVFTLRFNARFDLSVIPAGPSQDWNASSEDTHVFLRDDSLMHFFCCVCVFFQVNRSLQILL
jgi:hypothetical protein